MLDAIVVGCGPYGLAAAAALRRAGVNPRVFGAPMSFWQTRMPAGMKLRSIVPASDIGSNGRAYSLDSYLARMDSSPPGPVPLETFVEYGRWIQRELVPDIDHRSVARVTPMDKGFRVSTSDNESYDARLVVIATGIAAFTHCPKVFRSLPPELVSHSIDHTDLTAFAGRQVAVIGGGQSAIETAALLREGGAEVEVIVRADHLRWLRGRGEIRDRLGLIGPVVFPRADVGTPPLNQLIARPTLIRALPLAVRAWIDRRTMVPSVAGWLKPRIGGVTLTLGRHVIAAEPGADRVMLYLDDSGVREMDHVILATGFRVDIARLPFLPDSLLQRIRSFDGYPILSAGFESSIRGLYFVGAPAALSFGPITRFVAGSGFAAASVARSVMARGRAATEPVSIREPVGQLKTGRL